MTTEGALIILTVVVPPAAAAMVVVVAAVAVAVVASVSRHMYFGHVFFVFCRVHGDFSGPWNLRRQNIKASHRRRWSEGPEEGWLVTTRSAFAPSCLPEVWLSSTSSSSSSSLNQRTQASHIAGHRKTPNKLHVTVFEFSLAFGVLDSSASAFSVLLYTYTFCPRAWAGSTRA